MIAVIYAAVVLISNIVGAISGLGGGSIIKPILDLLHYHSVSEISFYSSVAVFTMSIVSTFKQLKSGSKIEIPMALLISIGSIIGGVLGNDLLNFMIAGLESEKYVSTLQIGITIMTLIVSYGYTRFLSQVSFKIHRNYSIAVGFVLGLLASFLGIGGGPLNVVALVMLYSMSMREATIYSIITIFFSQLSKLSSIFISQKYLHYDLSLLWILVPIAILGGYIGAYISQKVTQNKIAKIYQGVVILILVINFYNIFNLWI